MIIVALGGTNVLPLLMGLSLSVTGLVEFLPARQLALVRLGRMVGSLGVIVTFVVGVLWLVLSPGSFFS